MSVKAVVLDANILIRAVLGKRVREIVFNNAPKVNFFAPDVAWQDARNYLPVLLKKRGVDIKATMLVLGCLEKIVHPVDSEFYHGMRTPALQRILVRDADDWPVLACAMTLSCPIWTEDADFFGTGIATWTTDRIELYFL
jgi:predicted nucleic acid-binding protein